MIQISSISGPGSSSFDRCYSIILPSFAENRDSEPELIHIKFESPTMLRPKQPGDGWSMRKKRNKRQIWFWSRVPSDSVNWTDEQSMDYIFSSVGRAITESLMMIEAWNIAVDERDLTDHKHTVINRAYELLQDETGNAG